MAPSKRPMAVLRCGLSFRTEATQQGRDSCLRAAVQVALGNIDAVVADCVHGGSDAMIVEMRFPSWTKRVTVPPIMKP